MSLLECLNITQDANTALIKKKALSKILSKNKKEIFETLTYILNRHRKLSSYGKGSRFLSDKYGYMAAILDSLGFKYNKLRSDDLLIKSGSFYINGSWVHIG